MRAVGVGIVAAVGLYWLGAVFGLNGQQWEWWRSAAFAAAGLSIVVSVLRSRIRAALNPERNRLRTVVGALFGSTVLAVSVTVMSRRYSDPYSGRLFWPHTLAVVALLGFTLVAVCVAAWRGRPQQRA